MDICRNGALRQDFEVIRRSDGNRMAVVYTTTAKQAVSWFLKARKKECHEGERAKYVARSLASDMERLQFIASRPASEQRAYYRHYKLVPKNF